MPAGSLATIFAVGVLDDPGVVAADRIPLPTSLGGVSVTVGGIAAPTLAVTNVNGQEQINFQVPFELLGTASAEVVVTRGGVASTSLTVPVLDIQPAIYSTDGVNAVAVHNADFTLVSRSRPLQHNELAFLYAGGLGSVT